MNNNINLQTLSVQELQALQADIERAIEQYQSRIEAIVAEKSRRSQERVSSAFSDFSAQELASLQSQIEVRINLIDPLQDLFR
jgi:hypothetical protein